MNQEQKQPETVRREALEEAAAYLENASVTLNICGTDGNIKADAVKEIIAFGNKLMAKNIRKL